MAAVADVLFFFGCCCRHDAMREISKCVLLIRNKTHYGQCIYYTAARGVEESAQSRQSAQRSLAVKSEADIISACDDDCRSELRNGMMPIASDSPCNFLLRGPKFQNFVRGDLPPFCSRHGTTLLPPFPATMTGCRCLLTAAAWLHSPTT